MLNSRCEIQLYTGQGENISASRQGSVKFLLPVIGGLVLLLITFKSYSQDSLGFSEGRFDEMLKGHDIIGCFRDSANKQYMLNLFMQRAEKLHINYFIFRDHPNKEIITCLYIDKMGWKVNTKSGNVDP